MPFLGVETRRIMYYNGDSIRKEGNKMKFFLTFSCPAPVMLPLSYNHILQAALLNWLQDEQYTTFLHDVGFQKEQRVFKLYSFSELQGKHTLDKKSQKLVYKDTVTVCISSYMDEMEEYVKASLETERPLRLGKMLLPVESAYIVEDIYDDCIVQAISPITIHSTFELPTGTKKTYYYEPAEKDFSAMLRGNLIRKYKTVYDVEPENSDFTMIPLKDGNVKKKVVKYRDTVIIGWTGRFKMSGSPELLKMALLAGAGARNSMGFGCIVQLENKENN